MKPGRPTENLPAVLEAVLGDLGTEWSTLIGRAPTLLHSHWSRASLVLLAPAVFMVLYGIRAPIIGPFRAWKPTILWMPELVLYGIRLLDGVSITRAAPDQ